MFILKFLFAYFVVAVIAGLFIGWFMSIADDLCPQDLEDCSEED